MKSIRRVQKLMTAMLLIFLGAFAFLIYRLQSEAGFYISNASNVSLGFVYDRNGDVLFDPDADAQVYGSDYFLDIGNLIGDDSGQMSNTLVAKNIGKLANFSFMLGEVEDGKSAIYATLDHKANRDVYDAFGNKDGCAVAYNYQTGEIYICLSKPSVNILNHYEDLDELKTGSLMCKVFYPTVPGSMQKISTTISALESMGYDTLMQKRYTCEGIYTNLGGKDIKCHLATGHGEQDITKAFANSCNPFFAQLVEDVNLPLYDIQKTYEKMGYLVNGNGNQKYLNINGISAFTASTTLTDKTDFNTQWGCMGQGETLVSPLQMMVWQSAVANQSGIATNPYLISYITKVSGTVTGQAETSFGSQMFSAETAAHIREIMLENGKNNYSTLLTGTAVGVKSGTAQVENGNKENSLLTGFVDDPSFPIAFCIQIDDRVKGEITTSDIAKVMLQSLHESFYPAE
ncbi:MAG: ABC transporter permease [Oscillospiraceae bacterium]|nr:ABC transporter permease [Oscillospiraceae bacterium]